MRSIRPKELVHARGTLLLEPLGLDSVDMLLLHGPGFSAAARLPRLARLSFRNAEHGDAPAPELARGLRQHDQVTSLELIKCGIGDSGAREIADYMRASKTLTKLNLAGNRIGDEGAAAAAVARRRRRREQRRRALGTERVAGDVDRLEVGQRAADGGGAARG